MRLRRLDQRPRLVLVLIAASSAAVHGALTLLVRSPLFSPDEWLYAELSRSVLAGHPGDVTGGHISIWSTTSYVGPAITSPLWLIPDVNLAYHLSLVVGSVAFSLAVFPAYALARKVGLATGVALLAALLSQLIPAGAFTSTLLAEPYAYPAVLAAVLIAVGAIASPTPARIAGVAAASVALCLIAGMQFLVFPLAVVIAWITSATSLRGFSLRAVTATLGGAGLLVLVDVAGGGSVLGRIEDNVLYEHYPLAGTAGWFGINAFDLALATGWVIVPAAAVGLWRLLRTPERLPRAFGWLTVSLVAGVLAEAAIWGANGNGVYERFTFYASPLLVIACLRELVRHHDSGRLPYAVLGYAAAIAAILVPLTSYLIANAGHSPTLLGLTDDRAIRILWPIAAAILGVAAAATGAGRPRLLVRLGALALLVTTGLGFASLIHYQTHRAPDVHASKHAALLVDPVQPSYSRDALKMLFWNPHIDRIVVMGRGGSLDLPASVGGGLVATGIATGPRAQIRGPFVVSGNVSAWQRGRTVASGTASELAGTPDVLAFGWGPGGLMLPLSDILVAGDPHGTRRLTLRLSSLGSRVRLILDCTAGHADARTITVPRVGATRLVLDVPRNGSQECRLSLGPGSGTLFNEQTPVVRARLLGAAIVGASA